MSAHVVEAVGVYAADGGVVGELTYVVGHLLGRTECSLCDVTHGPVRRKRAWDEMAAVLVRRAAEIQGENCFKDAAGAKLDEKSKGARVVRIDFSPSEWKSE